MHLIGFHYKNEPGLESKVRPTLLKSKQLSRARRGKIKAHK